LKKHIEDPDANPLLIFPEGTCVNNEYTVMFKKVTDTKQVDNFRFKSYYCETWNMCSDPFWPVQGAFELDCTVCPIAIKYNKIFVDAFWNSKK
jgi:glycerol-3-phosphate O-acyltransferase 3/4